MEVLHFKHVMWLKDWFPSVPNGLVIKKDFTSYMFIGENSNRRKKSVEGVHIPETALPEVQRKRKSITSISPLLFSLSAFSFDDLKLKVFPKFIDQNRLKVVHKRDIPNRVSIKLHILHFRSGNNLTWNFFSASLPRRTSPLRWMLYWVCRHETEQTHNY